MRAALRAHEIGQRSPYELMFAGKGKSGASFHGASIADPGTASNGCIILSRAQREQIWASPTKLLRMVEKLA